MCLQETINRFIEKAERKTETLDPKSKECILLSLKISYCRDMLATLLKENTPKEYIIKVRDEFKKVIFNDNYVGKENEHLIKHFLRKDDTLIF